MNAVPVYDIVRQIRTPAVSRARMHVRISIHAAISQRAYDMMSGEALEKIAASCALSTTVSIVSPTRQFVYEYFKP